MSDERNTDTFQIVGFDQGGERVSMKGTNNHRLVCHIKEGGKIAIWGKKDSRRNIETVLNAGIPCYVECEYHAALDPWRTKYGHTYWVPQDSYLRVL